jgi:hypothetical protein
VRRGKIPVKIQTALAYRHHLRLAGEGINRLGDRWRPAATVMGMNPISANLRVVVLRLI